jgi:hypothetical protein
LVILCDTGSHLKEKINKRGGWGGQIVVPRPSASALLTGRRQKGRGTKLFLHDFIFVNGRRRKERKEICFIPLPLPPTSRPDKGSKDTGKIK